MWRVRRTATRPLPATRAVGRLTQRRAQLMRDRVDRAIDLMARFAERTGLTSGRSPRRYLWTDAFAVCNFLSLAGVTGEGRYTELALRLVARVHGELGRHRADDARTGWISGLGPQEGEAHPTRGGLRIGKPLPERGPGDRVDERLEWDRDGQYFHYLTKWMHALDQLARATGQAMFNLWACELAHAAHRAFVYASPDGKGKRMYWKLSVDLSRPQVASMGCHDPLDGLVTCAQLDATAARLGPASGPGLAAAAADFAAMLAPGQLATSDPLGLGGLLFDAHRVEQLTQQGPCPTEDDLIETILAATLAGLHRYVRQPDLQSPASHRLAFRELGLAIGLAAVERMHQDARREPGRFRGSPAARAGLEQLSRYVPLRAQIESFWLAPQHRGESPWLDHEDINDVMLATALLPEGFLVLRPVHAA